MSVESPAWWLAKPIRTARVCSPCCLCEQPIRLGDRIRDGGHLRRRAHQRCVLVLREQAPREPRWVA